MIISAQLNNNDVINYRVAKVEDKKIDDDEFAKELKYQENHLRTNARRKRYKKMMHYLVQEHRQIQKSIDNQILRESILQNINEVKKFNEEIQAYGAYKENQDGIKVYLT